MSTAAATLPISDVRRTPVPLILGGLAFLIAFGEPLFTLGRDWWTDPDAGHGLLLFPIAIWLAWKAGIEPEKRPMPRLGMALLVASILLRFVSGLAAELFTMRASLIGAAIGLILYTIGPLQLKRWWLSILLICLSVPLPDVLLGTLALPLQLKASQWGAALLKLRHVPVRLSGNVINLPGRSLFVTEACSGLRSLTALLALGLLIGGMWLRRPWLRVLLVAAAIPVAMMLNAVRIFLTGFFVYFVDPRLAEGVMHLTEGWAIFCVAFLILAAFAWLLANLEARVRKAPA
ncbi:MAG TPA: exosortase/archaeosortase family protein [Gemmatimonadales bacterium]